MSHKTADAKVKRQYKRGSKPRLIALEPRMLFDGAALATAVDFDQSVQIDSTQNISSENNVTTEFASATADTSAASDTPVAIDQNQIQAVASFSGLVDANLALAQSAGLRNELVIVDGSLENLQMLLSEIAHIDPSRTLLVLDPNGDESAQVTSFLMQHSAEFDAIHVVSHGGPGWVGLGNEVLRLDALEQDAAFWQSVKSGLNEMGDLLLYACQVTQD